jgi:hypothetical protein
MEKRKPYDWVKTMMCRADGIPHNNDYSLSPRLDLVAEDFGLLVRRCSDKTLGMELVAD